MNNQKQQSLLSAYFNDIVKLPYNFTRAVYNRVSERPGVGAAATTAAAVNLPGVLIGLGTGLATASPLAGISAYYTATAVYAALCASQDEAFFKKVWPKVSALRPD